MPSPQHERLIADLETLWRDWGAESLLNCLQRLRDAGPTEWRDVVILEAWPITDGFCVVYEMCGHRLGVRATRVTGEGSPFFFSRGVHGADPSLAPSVWRSPTLRSPSRWGAAATAL